MESFRKMLEESLERKDFKFLNLKENPFYTTVDPDISEIIERREEQKIFFRALTDLIFRRAEHIAILGKHGSGKTHLLRYIFNQLNNDNVIMEKLSKLNISGLDYIGGITEFRDIFAGSAEPGNSKFFPLTGPTRKINNKRTILFVDDLDVVASRLPQYLPMLFESFLVVGTWNLKNWDELKMTSGYHLPKPAVIKLTPLSERGGVQLLKLRVHESLIDKNINIFPEKLLIDFIKAVGAGNPYHLLSYAYRYLTYLLSIKKQPSYETLTQFLRGNDLLTYPQLSKNIKGLDSRKRDILKIITEKTEVSMNEVAIEIHSSRVWARSLLESLVHLNLVEKRRKGRTFFYFIPEDMEDIINEELNPTNSNTLESYKNNGGAIEKG